MLSLRFATDTMSGKPSAYFNTGNNYLYATDQSLDYSRTIV